MLSEASVSSLPASARLLLRPPAETAPMRPTLRLSAPTEQDHQTQTHPYASELTSAARLKIVQTTAPLCYQAHC